MGFVQPGWRWSSPAPKKPPLLDLKSFLGTELWNHRNFRRNSQLSWGCNTDPCWEHSAPHSSLFPAWTPPGRHSSYPKHRGTTAGSRIKMAKIQSKITEELPWVYLCFSAANLHLETILNLKAALKIPCLCYSTQHNIIQIQIYFTSYCKQQQGGRAGRGEQLEP